MIALDHLGAFAPLLLLERRLEEVHVKPCLRVEPAHHARRLDPVEPAISHQSADGRELVRIIDRVEDSMIRACQCPTAAAAARALLRLRAQGV
jgi:hypothetical protein